MEQNQNAYVVSSSLDGLIILWKLKKLQILEKVQTYTIPISVKSSSPQAADNVGITDMVYISLNQNIACIDLDKKVTYINLETNKIEKQLQAAYDGQLTTICLNEINHEIAVGDEAGEIKVFSNLDGKLLFLDQSAHGSPISSLAYSPDGKKLVSGDCYGKLLIWNVNP